MTVWQNLKINSFDRMLDRIYEFKKDISKVISYLKSVITYIRLRSKNDFLSVSIQKNKINIKHIKDCAIHTSISSDIETIKTSDISLFLDQHITLPMQILIDCEDVSYKAISLHQTKWWNRYGLFNQISIVEFEETDWTYSEYVPTPYDRFRHLFIGFRPTQLTLDAFSFIKTLRNPIAKIQLNSIRQTVAANTYLQKYNYMQTSYQWVLFIRKISTTEWLLSAQQYGAILLTRRGMFNSDKTDEEVIDAEISITLRYLYRTGYEENSELALIASGFSDSFLNHHFESANISNLITVSEAIIDQDLYSSSDINSFSQRNFWLFNRLISFFKMPCKSYVRELKPASMRNQYFAYWLPIYARQLIIPIIVLCVMTIINAKEIYHFNNLINTNTTKAEAIQLKVADLPRQKIAANYNVFMSLNGENPLQFLKILSSSLSKHMYISNFSWAVSAAKEKNKPFFEAILYYKDATVSDSSKHKKTKRMSDKARMINLKLKHHYPNIVVKIEPIANKSAYAVGVSWE